MLPFRYAFFGGAFGLFFGVSTGIAMGGAAFNGMYVFGLIFAAFGFLIGRYAQAQSKLKQEVDGRVEVDAKATPSGQVVNIPSENYQTRPGVLSFLKNTIWILGGFLLSLGCAIWNFQIDILQAFGALPAFQKRPWLFFVIFALGSLAFPPFSIIYVGSIIGALYCGLSRKNDYRCASEKQSQRQSK